MSLRISSLKVLKLLTVPKLYEPKYLLTSLIILLLVFLLTLLPLIPKMSSENEVLFFLCLISSMDGFWFRLLEPGVQVPPYLGTHKFVDFNDLEMEGSD